jgi:hypothetical protein
MIFNIAAGGLNIRDIRKQVSVESNGLAIANLALSVIYLCMLLPSCMKIMLKNKKNKEHTPVPFMGKMSNVSCLAICIIFILNIGYSIIVMDYFKTNKPIDKMLYDFSISIITIDSVAIVLKPAFKMVTGKNI